MPFTNANGRLLVCGTNAYKPKCRTLSQVSHMYITCYKLINLFLLLIFSYLLNTCMCTMYMYTYMYMYMYTYIHVY